MSSERALSLDLTGMRYGKLTAISPTRHNGARHWECKCDCGNYTKVRTNNLTSGKVCSCGCTAKRIINIGEKFGLLTVIENLPASKVKCICECGKTAVISKFNLMSGNTKSCGCQRMSGMKKALDFKGKRFGKLVAIERDFETPKMLRLTCAFWICKCDCGNTVSIRASALNKGQKSCGCITPAKKLRIDLTGMRFNKLTVIRRAEEAEKNYAQNTVCWLCKCDCGNFKIVTRSNLTNGRTGSCGCIKVGRKPKEEK